MTKAGKKEATTSIQGGTRAFKLTKDKEEKEGESKNRYVGGRRKAIIKGNDDKTAERGKRASCTLGTVIPTHPTRNERGDSKGGRERDPRPEDSFVCAEGWGTRTGGQHRTSAEYVSGNWAGTKGKWWPTEGKGKKDLQKAIRENLG